MADDAPQKTVDKRLTPGFLKQAGKGRPKGVPNKATKAVKEMILAALDEAGGIEYLTKQAKDNPTAFLTLVGKVLPMQMEHSGNVGQEVTFRRVDANG